MIVIVNVNVNVGPVSPFMPVGPVSPFMPVGPVGPVSPFMPVGPERVACVVADCLCVSAESMLECIACAERPHWTSTPARVQV